MHGLRNKCGVVMLVNGYLEDVQLTPREQEILLVLSDLYTNAEVAQQLCITSNTVKSHLRTVYQKLGVNTRGQAIRRARELDLL